MTDKTKRLEIPFASVIEAKNRHGGQLSDDLLKNLSWEVRNRHLDKSQSMLKMYKSWDSAQVVNQQIFGVALYS